MQLFGMTTHVAVYKGTFYAHFPLNSVADVAKHINGDNGNRISDHIGACNFEVVPAERVGWDCGAVLMFHIPSEKLGVAVLNMIEMVV